MKHDIATLTDQITSALNEFSGAAQKQARRSYKEARANVDDAMSDWQQRGAAAAESAYDAAYDAAMSLEESLEDTITARPLASVGIAVALGVLIGATWRR